MPDARPAGWIEAHPYLALLGAAACFAGNIVVGRAVHGLVPPFALTFWRWLVVVAVLAPFTAPALWRTRALVRRHALLLAALGTGSVTLYNGFFYLGVQHSTAINGALVTSTIPLLIALCAWLITRERVSARQGLAIALSLLGVLVILARGDARALAALHFGAGDLWLLAASLAWALYSVLLRYSPRELAGLPFVAITSLAGVVTILPLYAWERAGGATMTVNAASVGAIAFLALFPALAAYFLYSRAVVAVGPNRAGLFLHASPLFAIAAAIALLGEALHGYHLAGVALIALGLYLNARARHAGAAESL